jgi:leucyl-tRNA synthetase
LWDAIQPTPLGGLSLQQQWPQFNPALAKEDEITYPIQINGKLRSHVVLPVDSPEDVVRERVLADEKVKAAIAGKEVAKVIVIAGKLVNVVVK